MILHMQHEFSDKGVCMKKSESMEGHLDNETQGIELRV